MPQWIVRGPIGDEVEVEHEPFAAESALHALYIVHRDGVGPGRVRLAGGRIRFSDLEAL
jgi:hypothetical protein